MKTILEIDFELDHGSKMVDLIYWNTWTVQLVELYIAKSVFTSLTCFEQMMSYFLLLIKLGKNLITAMF